MKTKWLIYSGIFVPIVFWTTILFCGFIMGNDNHYTRQVSELGAIGSPSQYFFTIGLLLGAILSVFFIVGLYKTSKQIGLNPIPVFIIITYSISICGAALFPLPLRLHGIIGMSSVFLFLSPFLSLILWWTKNISNMKLISLLSFLIMALGFLAFMPTVLSEYSGLKQRFFHIGWTIWFIYLSIRFIGIMNISEVKHNPAVNPG
jgi:hypothetical protein